MTFTEDILFEHIEINVLPLNNLVVAVEITTRSCQKEISGNDVGEIIGNHGNIIPNMREIIGNHAKIVRRMVGSIMAMFGSFLW